MTEDAWSNDPRFSKNSAVQEFAGLRETVEKAAGFVAGIEPTPEQISSSTDTPGSAEASYSQQQVDDLVAAARAEGAAGGHRPAGRAARAEPLRQRVAGRPAAGGAVVVGGAGGAGRV